jgi:phosphonate transport system substrate-binding protein
MDNQPKPLLIGATAADPKRVVFIWNAIRKYFNEAGLPVEYALYSTYDALCDHLLRGIVDIAWNAPMAHAQSLIAGGGDCRTLAMRDTDEGNHTLLVTMTESGIGSIDELRGRRIAMGVPISSELWLLPVGQLAEAGLDVERDCELIDLTPTTYSNQQAWVDDGTIFGAIVDGTVDAGVIFEPWLEPLLKQHGMAESDVTTLWQTRPYSHCAFTSAPGLGSAEGSRFVELLLAMDPDDPEIAEMMRMEHLGKWVQASDDGWHDLIQAIDAAGLAGETF